MPSTATKTTIDARMKNILASAAPATNWADANLEEGVRLAIEEYSRHRPLTAVGVLTPANLARELDVSSLTGLQSVTRVWFPYTAAAPEWPPNYIEFDFWMNAGVPWIRLGEGQACTGAAVARIFYTKVHTLNGLDAAAATTWPLLDDGLMVQGAAGYACLQRSVDLNETSGNMFVSTPNYGALAEIYLTEFRQALYGGEDWHQARMTSRGLII